MPLARHTARQVSPARALCGDCRRLDRSRENSCSAPALRRHFASIEQEITARTLRGAYACQRRFYFLYDGRFLVLFVNAFRIALEENVESWQHDQGEKCRGYQPADHDDRERLLGFGTDVA